MSSDVVWWRGGRREMYSKEQNGILRERKQSMD